MSDTRIMVVDDDTDTLDFMEVFLESEGYQVFMRSSVVDLSYHCYQHQPHLLIIDLHIHAPDVGWYALQAIRSQQTTAHIPILLYSSDPWALQVHKGEVQSMGCDVLTKPFDPDVMHGKIKALTNTIAN